MTYDVVVCDEVFTDDIGNNALSFNSISKQDLLTSIKISLDNGHYVVIKNEGLDNGE